MMIQLRQQDLDVKFYRKVVDMVLKSEELAKLKGKASFDDGLNEWSIPMFMLKAKEVALPSLSMKKTEDSQRQQQEDQYSSDENQQQAQGQQNHNNFMAQYEAANQRRSVQGGENSGQG